VYALSLSSTYSPNKLANSRNCSSGLPYVLNALAVGENSPKYSVS
jgi:hypothetical protein